MASSDILDLPYRACVGLCIVNATGLVWAGERIDTPNAWQMPQGGIDKGELPQDAALRELWEETGLRQEHIEIERESSDWLYYDLPETLIPSLWNGQYKGQKQKWFLLRFKASDDVVNIKTTAPEFNRWAWFSPHELLNYIVPFKKETYLKVFEEFKFVPGA